MSPAHHRTRHVSASPPPRRAAQRCAPRAPRCARVPRTGGLRHVEVHGELLAIANRRRRPARVQRTARPSPVDHVSARPHRCHGSCLSLNVRDEPIRGMKLARERERNAVDCSGQGQNAVRAARDGAALCRPRPARIQDLGTRNTVGGTTARRGCGLGRGGLQAPPACHRRRPGCCRRALSAARGRCLTVCHRA